MWWWIAMGLAAAVLALPCVRLRRRRAQRVRLDLIREQVERSLSALSLPVFSGTSVVQLNPQQPDGSPDSRTDVEAANPPTASASVAASPSKSAVRRRRRVVLSDPADLSAALFPGWRLR